VVEEVGEGRGNTQALQDGFEHTRRYLIVGLFPVKEQEPDRLASAPFLEERFHKGMGVPFRGKEGDGCTLGGHVHNLVLDGVVDQARIQH
jgi:hypothetical protein